MRPAGQTELQVALRALADALLDSRERLTEREYIVLISCLVELVAAEAARCARWQEHLGADPRGAA